MPETPSPVRQSRSASPVLRGAGFCLRLHQGCILPDTARNRHQTATAQTHRRRIRTHLPTVNNTRQNMRSEIRDSRDAKVTRGLCKLYWRLTGNATRRLPRCQPEAGVVSRWLHRPPSCETSRVVSAGSRVQANVSTNSGLISLVSRGIVVVASSVEIPSPDCC